MFLVKLYYYNFDNVCLSFCLFVQLFHGYFETDLDALWHIVYFWSWEVPKTIFEKTKKPGIGEHKCTEI